LEEIGGTPTTILASTVGATIQATSMKNENNNNTDDDILNNNNSTNTLRRHRLISPSTSTSKSISTEPTNRTTIASLSNTDTMSSSSNLSLSLSSPSLSYEQQQPIRRFQKKAPRSILSLSWQRWIVRYLTLTRTSQVIMVLIVICLALLLPPTIYLMSSSLSSQTMIWTMDQSYYNGNGISTEIQSRTRRNKRKRSDAKNNLRKISNPQVNDIFMNNYDEEQQQQPLSLKFDRNNTSFERFFHRTTFPSPREPRVVKLTDQNHTFRLSMAPGFAAVNDEELFDIKQWGLRELKQSYVEIRMTNPKYLHQAESLDKGDCQPVAPSWQLSHNPTCNIIHEESSGWQQLYQLPSNLLTGIDPKSMELEWEEKKRIEKHNLIDPDRDENEQMRLVNQGAFRHVWMIRDHDGVTKRAMKTLRSLRSKEKKFDLRNHDRHRRDAIAFDELHKSSLVVDIYGHCSNTAIFDYADGGDLTRIYDEDSPEPTKLDILRIAYNVSLSIHDAHHIDEEGRPTMAHTDIKADQFIYQDGYYKLSDFNRVRFLMWNQTVHKWNQTSDGQCGFDVARNGGEYRSPEEYAYEKETEKVDVFSLGNVLYFLLVGIEPWEGVNLKDVYKFVIAKQRPKIPDEIYNNPGVYERCMIRAMENAWIHNKHDRPSALQVANIIKEGINILEKHD